MRGLLSGLVVCCLMSMSSLVSAECVEDPEFRRHNRDGATHYREGRFHDAAKAFERALARCFNASDAWNQARAFERARELSRAEVAYESYLLLNAAPRKETARFRLATVKVGKAIWRATEDTGRDAATLRQAFSANAARSTGFSLLEALHREGRRSEMPVVMKTLGRLTTLTVGDHDRLARWQAQLDEGARRTKLEAALASGNCAAAFDAGNVAPESLSSELRLALARCQFTRGRGELEAIGGDARQPEGVREAAKRELFAEVAEEERTGDLTETLRIAGWSTAGAAVLSLGGALILTVKRSDDRRAIAVAAEDGSASYDGLANRIRRLEAGMAALYTAAGLLTISSAGLFVLAHVEEAPSHDAVVVTGGGAGQGVGISVSGPLPW